MQEIKFKKPKFRKGLNVTVRKGTKWAERIGQVKEGKPFVVLEMFDENKNEIGFLFPWDVIIRNFGQVRYRHLIFEHDPNCRTVEGFKKVMQDIYGEIKEDEKVTFIYFLHSIEDPELLEVSE